MAHECFEQQEVATILNRDFVSIKVDREELPDVDETYMTATQIFSGRGGWPMSVFLTPDRKPFYAGTYFPLRDRGRQIGFLTLCDSVSKAWKVDPEGIRQTADELSAVVSQVLNRTVPAATEAISFASLLQVVDAFWAEFDTTFGGFGNAPKFPPYCALQFLCRFEQFQTIQGNLESNILEMINRTLLAMSRGGIFDHVAGGFHRYSTDAEWRLPHFEKMLYDNALLMECYYLAGTLNAYASPSLASELTSVSRRIGDWLLYDMRLENGLFASSMDADTNGEEGATYTWTIEEIQNLLGPNAANFCKEYDVRPEGNFRDEASGQLGGQNVLFQTRQCDRYSGELQTLLQARKRRAQPNRDDKAIVAWNGLAINALCECRRSKAPEIVAAVIYDHFFQLGYLPRTIIDDKPFGHGYLEDYGAMALAASKLVQKGNLRNWQWFSKSLLDQAQALFGKDDRPGYSSTCDAHDRLLGSPIPVFDNPIPSGNALLLQAALDMGLREFARDHIQGLSSWIQLAPTATTGLALVALNCLERDFLNSCHSIEDHVLQAREEHKQYWADQAIVATLQPAVITLRRGQLLHLSLQIKIKDNWRIIAANQKELWPIPLAIECKALALSVTYPQSESNYYEGSTVLELKSMQAVEESQHFDIRIIYQACNESECLRPNSLTVSGEVIVID